MTLDDRAHHPPVIDMKEARRILGCWSENPHPLTCRGCYKKTKCDFLAQAINQALTDLNEGRTSLTPLGRL